MSTVTIIILVVLYLLGVFITPFWALLFKVDDALMLVIAWFWPMAIILFLFYKILFLPVDIFDWLDIHFSKENTPDNDDDDDDNLIKPFFDKTS